MENKIKDWAREKAQEVHRISYTQLDDWHVIEAALLEAVERGRKDAVKFLISSDETLLRECWAALETMGERHGDCPDKRCGHNFACDECVQVANISAKLRSRLT